MSLGLTVEQSDSEQIELNTVGTPRGHAPGVHVSPIMAFEDGRVHIRSWRIVYQDRNTICHTEVRDQPSRVEIVRKPSFGNDYYIEFQVYDGDTHRTINTTQTHISELLDAFHDKSCAQLRTWLEQLRPCVDDVYTIRVLRRLIRQAQPDATFVIIRDGKLRPATNVLAHYLTCVDERARMAPTSYDAHRVIMGIDPVLITMMQSEDVPTSTAIAVLEQIATAYNARASDESMAHCHRDTYKHLAAIKAIFAGRSPSSQSRRV